MQTLLLSLLDGDAKQFVSLLLSILTTLVTQNEEKAYQQLAASGKEILEQLLQVLLGTFLRMLQQSGLVGEAEQALNKLLAEKKKLTA